jgi:hypothetical protein
MKTALIKIHKNGDGNEKQIHEDARNDWNHRSGKSGRKPIHYG